MRTDEQVASYIGMFTMGSPPSPVGLRVARLLEAWQGLHHLPNDALKKAEWHHPLFIRFAMDVTFSPGGLATFDFDDLTRLVFLAHDHCIRVELRPHDRTRLHVLFHPRTGREGDFAKRHPTLETAIEKWRSANPAPVPAEGAVA